MRFRSVLVSLIMMLFLFGAVTADSTDDTINSAGKLYSDSVDLANEGKFTEALKAADAALALNVTSLTPLIQSNRAGILVMLGQNDEAIAAADAALGIEGNLTTTHSIAWYNKANALRALGRIDEAAEAYARAYALDNTLVPPDMSRDIPVSPTRKSPLPFLSVLAALGAGIGAFAVSGKK